MPWNGSGTYSPPAASFPEVNGTVIDATRFNATLNDVAAGVTAALAKNGENIPTANLPMGGFVHTGLGQAATTGQTLAWGKNGNFVDLTVTGAMAFTSTSLSGITNLTTTGNTILGDATTDTLNVGAGTLQLPGNGRVGVNVVPAAAFHVDSTVNDEVARLNATSNPFLSFYRSGVRYGYMQFTSTQALLNVDQSIPLLFSINASERMRIDTAGKVGIGGTPTKTLDVFGSIRQKNLIDGTDTISLADAGGVLRGNVYSASNYLEIDSVTNIPLIFGTNSTERARIDGSGHLLVGTTSAVGVNLQATGSAAITAAGGAQYLLMGNQDSGGTNKPLVFQSANASLSIGTGDSWASSTGGTLTTNLFISSTGNVGIGSTSPAAKFMVSGGTTIASLTDWNSKANTVFQLANAAVRFGVGYTAADIVELQSFDTTNTARALSINRYGGLVGIGKTPTTYALEINGDAQATNFRGALVGNASTATALQTARNINGTAFDGTASITVTASANTLTGTALPALDGSALTSLNASNLGSGTVPDARFPATLPAASGVNLTALNASNLASGTVGTARLGSGTANSTKYLRGDNTWQDAPLSGTYTPTLTNVTNAGSLTAYACQYLRVGNVVTVSGQFGITPTVGGTYSVGISLPIASAFTTNRELGGFGQAIGPIADDIGGSIYSDAANGRANLGTSNTATGARFVQFHFTYLVQ